MKLLKAWVLKRKLLDEHMGEVGGALLFFYDQPAAPANSHYEWIRMEHLDQKDKPTGSNEGPDNPGFFPSGAY